MSTHRIWAITIPEDVEVIDMHYAEQVWAKRAEKRGETNERQKNIGIAIDMCRSFGATEEAIAAKLVELYKLSRKEAIAQVKARLSGNISNPALS